MIAVTFKNRAVMRLLPIVFPVFALSHFAHAATKADAGTDAFDRAFALKGKPASVHYTAEYLGNGTIHHVAAWRDGDRRVMRRTDDRLEIYGEHDARGPDFTLTVVDLKRNIRSTVDRAHLAQIGHFMDWNDLAYALRRPVAGYRVAALAGKPALPEGVSAAGPCRWFELTDQSRHWRICWSASAALPFLILDDEAHVQWRITSVEKGPIAASRFEAPTAGLVLNDVSADISGD
jgi:hypothetical protein